MTSSFGKPCSFRRNPYFAFPRRIFERFAEKTCSTRASRAGPVTTSRPMWQRSKMPACWRTSLVSSRMPTYWTGISHPWKSTRRAPAATCAALSGVFLMALARAPGGKGGTLPRGREGRPARGRRRPRRRRGGDQRRLRRGRRHPEEVRDGRRRRQEDQGRDLVLHDGARGGEEAAGRSLVEDPADRVRRRDDVRPGRDEPRARQGDARLGGR